MRTGDTLHHHRPILPLRHHGFVSWRHEGDGIFGSSHGAVHHRHSGHKNSLDIWFLSLSSVFTFSVHFLSGFLDRHHRHAGGVLFLRPEAVPEGTGGDGVRKSFFHIIIIFNCFFIISKSDWKRHPILK